MLEEVMKPFSRRAAIDQYLAQSHDIFDLEYRIEKLARKGVLWSLADSFGLSTVHL